VARGSAPQQPAFDASADLLKAHVVVEAEEPILVQAFHAQVRHSLNAVRERHALQGDVVAKAHELARKTGLVAELFELGPASVLLDLLGVLQEHLERAELLQELSRNLRAYTRNSFKMSTPETM
jgi:hypothetical protein